MDRKLLDGKRCVVTGGSKGIGLAIVEAFLAEGASVEYYSRSKASSHDALAASAKAADRSLVWTSCDVSDPAALEKAVEASVAAGPVDVLVNNAGITRDGLVFRMSVEDWNAVLATNLTSAFVASRTVARAMIKRRAGSIINLSSVVGMVGNGGQTNYAASKAGVIGFTKSLAKEVASRGVRVNAVAPGFVDTAMTEAIPAEAKAKLAAQIPLGRVGLPSEIAAAVVFLASDMSSYVTGEVLKADGGMAM